MQHSHESFGSQANPSVMNTFTPPALRASGAYSPTLSNTYVMIVPRKSPRISSQHVTTGFALEWTAGIVTLSEPSDKLKTRFFHKWQSVLLSHLSLLHRRPSPRCDGMTVAHMLNSWEFYFRLLNPFCKWWMHRGIYESILSSDSPCINFAAYFAA